MILCELMEKGIEPKRAHSDDGGYDLFFPSNVRIESTRKIGLKVKVLLPMGWTGRIIPRSSGDKDGVYVNGTIDRYTGEVFLNIRNMTDAPLKYEKGHSVAQLLPVFTGAGLKRTDFYLEFSSGPKHDSLYKILTACNDLKVVEQLPKTERGDKGYGSTGNRPCGNESEDAEGSS